MKISYMSDLHLEIDDSFTMNNECNSDILILAGDIFVAEDLRRAEVSSKFHLKQTIIDFIEKSCKLYSHVVYVLGNHEHYHGVFSNTLDIIKQQFAHISNLHILDKESILIDEVLIYGGTLWTDFGGNPLAQLDASFYMNDYKVIRENESSYKKLTPAYILSEHIKTKQALIEAAKLGNPMIVVSHHAPSVRSINEKYRSDSIINHYYYSDLTDIFNAYPNIKYWIHGHIHDSVEYSINSTTILSNPYGHYGNNDKFTTSNYIEV